jgi:hypothetical protein
MGCEALSEASDREAHMHTARDMGQAMGRRVGVGVGFGEGGSKPIAQKLDQGNPSDLLEPLGATETGFEHISIAPRGSERYEGFPWTSCCVKGCGMAEEGGGPGPGQAQARPSQA